jgi:hypothetical protein
MENRDPDDYDNYREGSPDKCRDARSLQTSNIAG